MNVKLKNMIKVNDIVVCVNHTDNDTQNGLWQIISIPENKTFCVIDVVICHGVISIELDSDPGYVYPAWHFRKLDTITSHLESEITEALTRELQEVGHD